MCGIVGYVGAENAPPRLLAGLKRLEYRGYDSAGLAVLNRQLHVIKAEGRIARLEQRLNEQPVHGTLGLAHTRWATHGRPSDSNAHPHLDCTGRIAVVHNGIIENHQDLRAALEAAGHRFASETDTEVLPHLIESLYQGDLVAAVRGALAQVRGSYAIGVACSEEPNLLVAARKDSPLVVGLGQGENYLASDIPALLPYTRRVLVLEDGDVARIEAGRVQVWDASGRLVDRRPLEVGWDPEAAERGGYPHFMLKEIHEQPRAIRDTLRGRLDPAGGTVQLEGLRLGPAELAAIKRVSITAAGTAWHAGLIGKHLIERLARLPVEVELSSEFRYREPLFLGPRTLVVVISQSGETADTLAALREARRRGAHVLAITNVVGSSIAREADSVLFTQAGPEVAVASTKAYLTQLVCLALLAVHLAECRGEGADRALARSVVEGLVSLPQGVDAALTLAPQVAGLARRYSGSEHLFFIGRGIDHALAMEGALKLKEISYIHAEAYAAGELKHGTLALVVEGTPVVAVATQGGLLEKMASNVAEVQARGARVIALAPEGFEAALRGAQHALVIPGTPELLAPVVAAVPLQLFAYHAAVARGCDVDKPRNLAKSVTVE